MSEQEKPKVKRVRCEVYSRIVGYLRPVQNWHEAKRLEFSQRRTYDVPAAAKLETMGDEEAT
jgi:anaerobic ribonucleoside-triphosphate reductase